MKLTTPVSMRRSAKHISSSSFESSSRSSSRGSRSGITTRLQNPIMRQLSLCSSGIWGHAPARRFASYRHVGSVDDEAGNCNMYLHCLPLTYESLSLAVLSALSTHSVVLSKAKHCRLEGQGLVAYIVEAVKLSCKQI